MKRHLQASTRLAEHLDWPGLRQVCRLERTTLCQGKTTVEVQYAITSLARSQANPERLCGAWRGHWGIENRLHWVRDVTYGEDHCRVKTASAPQNLAAFRNAAIGLLRLEGYQEIAPTLRNFAYQASKLLAFLGIVKN